MLWAGGEAGQLYRVSLDGRVEEVARLPHFVLGVAVDAAGAVYACCQHEGVWRWDGAERDAGRGRLRVRELPGVRAGRHALRLRLRQPLGRERRLHPRRRRGALARRAALHERARGHARRPLALGRGVVRAARRPHRPRERRLRGGGPHRRHRPRRARVRRRRRRGDLVLPARPRLPPQRRRRADDRRRGPAGHAARRADERLLRRRRSSTGSWSRTSAAGT